MAENDYVDDVKNTQSLESLSRLALEICMSLDHGSFSSTQSWLTVRMRMPSTLSSAGSFSFSRPRARGSDTAARSFASLPSDARTTICRR
jgi:hypothetical protein